MFLFNSARRDPIVARPDFGISTASGIMEYESFTDCKGCRGEFGGLRRRVVGCGQSERRPGGLPVGGIRWRISWVSGRGPAIPRDWIRKQLKPFRTGCERPERPGY